MLRTRRNSVPHFTVAELAKVQGKLLEVDALMKEHLQKHFKMKLNHSKYHMQVRRCKIAWHMVSDQAHAASITVPY